MARISLRSSAFLAGVFSMAVLIGCEEGANTVVPVSDGTSVSIKLSQRTLRSCDALLIHVELAYEGDDSAMVKYCEPCDTLAYYVTTAGGYTVQPRTPNIICAACTETGTIALHKGEKVSATFVFATTDKYFNYHHYDCLPSGSYTVHAGDKYRQHPWVSAGFCIEHCREPF